MGEKQANKTVGNDPLDGGIERVGVGRLEMRLCMCMA
jgi:hypothetical protein